MPNIAIVGTGPTGLYTLHRLLNARTPLTVTLFEASPLAGVGLPYSPDSAQVTMLANIASIEIPPLGETYLDWLRRQPAALLRLYGADPATLHDRQFLPRLLLGAWFRDALERMIAGAAAQGHRVALREGTRVTDVAVSGDDLRLVFQTAGVEESLLFSHVVLATGHDWPEDPAHDPGHFVSPWSGLIEAAVPPSRVGVLGTSLSAIDAAMAVACQHGRFDPDDDGFTLLPGSERLKITLMSRNGLLPEADFWCPLPYLPLRHLTEDALDREARAGSKGLLDRLWRLMVAELASADPAWTAANGIAHLSVEGFADAYFAPRLACDPFDWAAQNLAEVTRNADARRVVDWRYAILRMHAPMERMVGRLTGADRLRFEALKRVFIDNYAAVPPQAIRRLLALRRAGCLEVLALGKDYALDRADGVARLVARDGTRAAFDVLIDARGQKALTAADLPFPSLRAALGTGDVAMDDTFAIRDLGAGRIFLPAAPYLLSRFPFAQGITASADMAASVAAALVGP
ncbi:MAG: FAD/NAD(P)-binding protein [Paracoccaceae bacterium]|nr:FAD/NAD(P)-binding protein [Paracoccaceae bacterium]